jgi:hypothetical protein
MPRCKKSSNRYYTGKEPSPKGLGYCASSDEEGKVRKGRDGNMWIKKGGKWVKDNIGDVKEKSIKKKMYDLLTYFTKSDYTKDEDEIEYYEENLDKKLYKWWLKLSEGNIILIYKNGKHKLVTSSMKTHKAQSKDILNKWSKYGNDDNVEAIIWSAQSVDTIQEFISYLIKNNTKTTLDKMIKMKDLPSYLLKNYKEYFLKYKFSSEKDYLCFREM